MLVISVGVPVICPVAMLKFNPVGKLGLIANASVPYPPVPVTGVNGAATAVFVNTLSGTAIVVMISPATTDMDTFCELV